MVQDLSKFARNVVEQKLNYFLLRINSKLGFFENDRNHTGTVPIIVRRV